MHEKYNGYNPFTIEKKCLFTYPVYAKRPKVQNVNIKNISTAFSQKITVIILKKHLA